MADPSKLAIHFSLQTKTLISPLGYPPLWGGWAAMNTNIANKLTQILNKISRSRNLTTRGKRTRRRGRNRRYNFGGIAYNESAKPQRYGPGKTLRNIEAYFEAFKDSYFNLNSLLSGNTEHLTMCTLYNYFKIINLGISFYPSQAQVSTGYINLQLNWNNQDNTQIPFEDNVKIVPVFRTRKYFFKFVPLNIPLILGDSTKPVVINMMNFMRTSDPIVIPGCFNFDSEQAFTARVKVTMRVEYRGSKVPDSTGLSNLATVVRNTELPRRLIKREEIKIGQGAMKQIEEEEEDKEVSMGKSEVESVDEIKQ